MDDDVTMVQVLCSSESGELELTGRRPDLRALGRLLRGRAGTHALTVNQNPFPYEMSLQWISMREYSDRDTASITADGHTLRIHGGRAALDLLADNVEGFAAEADATDHCHVDFPTYSFISAESHPLVIAFPRQAGARVASTSGSA
ncbi:hypothetical protein GCM10010495_38690 [Kitasatospora herbaricolor]|uniref:Imm32 family immunity protein n=1 Tax=Kitasatospora herbaricolor TaxID=68217 RepID=UPI0017488695|nr:hypothetical protein [Kitasatospora herbaricolor]MDQ0313307.1 hypothetical protein [Kitasatospora herbaricolor]GGV19883.1 hypothetical protein GCM10010495_38690 [Kitasatospora herbaricolor]